VTDPRAADERVKAFNAFCRQHVRLSAECEAFISGWDAAERALVTPEDSYSAAVQFDKYHAMRSLLMVIANSDNEFSRRAAEVLAGERSEAIKRFIESITV
jgi:hypothetical protein